MYIDFLGCVKDFDMDFDLCSGNKSATSKESVIRECRTDGEDDNLDDILQRAQCVLIFRQ